MSRETAAIRATYAAFAGIGVINASWAARIPQVKSQLGLSSSALGLVLLAIAAGSLLSLPGRGRWWCGWARVARCGGSRCSARRASSSSPSAPVARSRRSWPGCFSWGSRPASGTWRSTSRARGSSSTSDRPLMSRFHAWYGVGTVIGAIVGRRDGRRARVGDRATCCCVACIRRRRCGPPAGAFFPTTITSSPTNTRAARSHNAWRERRTVLIGMHRARVRADRGQRQRLDQRLDDPGPPRGARPRHARLRPVSRDDDREPLERSAPARADRAGALAAPAHRDRGRRAARVRAHPVAAARLPRGRAMGNRRLARLPGWHERRRRPARARGAARRRDRLDRIRRVPRRSAADRPARLVARPAARARTGDRPARCPRR